MISPIHANTITRSLGPLDETTSRQRGEPAEGVS